VGWRADGVAERAMMPATMSDRDRRVLVLGGMTIALVIGAARGLPAWREWYTGSRASAVRIRDELARAQASLRYGGVTRDSLVARKRRLVALLPLLASGETPQMAGAGLASHVASAAEAAGVRVGTVQVRPDSAGRTVFTRLAVRADVTGDVRGITTFLSALEHDATLLAVRELAVSQPEPAAPADRVEALRVELLVEGLALTPRRARAVERLRRTP
jgi:hypothetical protein